MTLVAKGLGFADRLAVGLPIDQQPQAHLLLREAAR
jgi:hypothetical protein